MGRFVAGQVVIVSFPFSDLSQSKLRPALVLVDLPGNDFVACMITKQDKKDRFSVAISNVDFVSGAITHDSFVRLSKLFTAHDSLVTRVAGTISTRKFDEIVTVLISQFFGR